MKKIIILFFVFLVIFSIAFAAELFPIQVYGDITPDLPEDYTMSFQINGVEYESGIASVDYGWSPQVKIPVDDNTTLGIKEGYARGDTVEVYINGILVDSQQYQYLPEDGNYTPYQIDIQLTNDEYDDIIGHDECTRNKCSSDECQTSSVCLSVGCRWSDGQCRAPSTGGSGGSSSRGCYDKWACGEWSECSADENQSRICNNTGTCKNVRPTKTEYQNCTYTAPIVDEEEEEVIIPVEEPTSEVEEEIEEVGFGLLFYIIIAIVVAGLGFGFVFYEIEHSRKHLESEKTMHHEEVHPNTYANLESYIRKTLEIGYTSNQIRQTLLKEGWSQCFKSC